MKIGVITRNPTKIALVKYVFSKSGINYDFIDQEFPEIQAPTSREIAEFTAVQASKELKKTVVRQDDSLFIRSLGIPGPFTTYIEKMMPADKLLELLLPFKDRSGYFECAVALASPGKETKSFVERFEIEVNEKEAGDLAPPRAWDRVLKFKGETRTFGEYPVEKRVPIWARVYEDLVKYIQETDLSPRQR